MTKSKNLNFSPLRQLCAGIALLTAMTSASAAVIVNDSFESGNLSAPGTTDFAWLGPAGDAGVVSKGAKTGQFSLGFTYPAGEPWAEVGFTLNVPRPEVWMRYWIRVPTNFLHSATGSNGAVNNKFMSIWMDGYDARGDGSSFWLSMERSGNGNSDLAFTYTKGSNTGSLAYSQQKPFINAQSDRGRWMQIVLHLKAQSAPGVNNGVIETWRRWESESGFTQLHKKTDVPLRVPASGAKGFSRGYLLGWANGEYDQATEWFIDDFTMSTTSLLNGGGTAPAPTPEELSKPVAPKLTSAS